MGPIGLKAVEERVAAAAAEAGRSDPITIVVVTKNASDSDVEAAITEGVRDLGESRADALATRAVRFPGASWHFVGRLQGNKVRLVRPAVELLHSMDRLDLARYWSRGETRPPPVLIQVNLAGEPQKAGVAPDEVRPVVERCVASGIEARGLMTVPPRPETAVDSGRWFAALRHLRDKVALDHPQLCELSMGMSDDFGIAVAEGATILRVGRAIFGSSRNEG